MGVGKTILTTFFLGVLLTNAWMGWNYVRLYEDPPTPSRQERQATSAVVGEVVADALVAVSGGRFPRSAMGSGFFISSTGLVVTSAHVVDDPQGTYEVVTAQGERFAVERVIRSRTSDIALLQTEARNNPFLRLEQAPRLTAGEVVTAVGPGAGWLASSGPVLGVGHNVITDIETIEMDVIQAAVTVRPGSSGGPLLNGQGEVVGVIFAFSPENPAIGFAIPSDRLDGLLEGAQAAGISWTEYSVALGYISA